MHNFNTSSRLILGAKAIDCFEAKLISPVCCFRTWLGLFTLLKPLFFSSREFEFALANFGLEGGSFDSEGVGEGVVGAEGVLQIIHDRIGRRGN